MSAIQLPDLTRERLSEGLYRWKQLLQRWLALPAIQERGRTLEATVTTAATAIDHGLGTVPAGWIVLRAVGATPASVVEVSSTDKTLTLQASATVTLTLWVWP